jgi:branched-chain amino acid transport system ATP-binding protein
MSEPILEITNLTKDFGGVRAVNKVDLDVDKGELLGVIGPNGSGKTTLVNLVSGFIKPSGGRVVFMGKNITGWPPHRVTDLGLVRTFQMVRPFYKLAAYKNMIVPLTSRRVRRQVGGKYGDRDAVAKDLLEEVGFERDSAVILKPASELPHGYLKRIELARCIALEAELIILDELFSGLSLAEVATIVPVIEKLRVQGKTVIMIEHRLKELFRIADRVMVLNYGSKIAEGPPRTIMDDEAVKTAYLGSQAERE